ncbi:hypothetical protein E2562_008867 [Oryza meyeriana var. granulata]|uniref:C2 NT-type domain-containing protein n=1 Tax=Oryza meyeriana var. granulata TaxID=110450 RepID=A0A6G1D0G6_9ORYZ|nr:hypothetical protein E2562_008867 [Oryza meyeriana var. granulata]
MADDGKSNNQILQALDALSHTLYQAHTNRRTASLAFPRSAADVNGGGADVVRAESRPRLRRLWKPIRALSHIGMNRLGCLFSVEVVAAQGLPPTMNGLRLAVAVRKKETRDGAVQTMPSRVQQGAADFEETLFVVAAQGLPPSMNGLRLAVAVRKKETRDDAVQTMPSRVQHGAADFEETLFVRCHLYCSGGAGTGKPLKFEPRPFLLAAVAVEAPELDFGRSAVDLSLLVKESTDKSQQGERVRQWDMALPLAGKAKGGELVVKLSFQIMDDGGVGLYSQPGGAAKTSSSSSSLFARKQSKMSFSITSPKVSRPEPTLTPTKGSPSPDLKGIDDFKLDETSPPLMDVKQEQKKVPEPPEPEEKADDSEFPEFDIVDKGVEGQEENEVVHDSAHAWRINELEAITNQIKALESMMLGDTPAAAKEEEPQDDDAAGLDTDEEEVTREFLQLLEQGDGRGALTKSVSSLKSGAKRGSDAAASSYISDLGKGLGPIVQTRDGGYLAATNPFDIPVERKELPKLAMQLSKPFILRDQRLPGGGAELFQRLCAGGCETLFAKLAALIATDEVVGKTAEQIAFEGMADGRKERIATGIWNAQETPVTVDEILAFSLQKIEAMAIEALKVQSDMADEQAPFDVSPVSEKRSGGHLLDTAVPPEEWALACMGADTVTMLLVAQLRDPLRRYEAVGAPSIVIIQAIRAAGSEDDEPRFKVANMHVGGLRLKSADRRNVWDGEKQRLTAMHWLVAYGLGKAGRKGRTAAAAAKAGHDVLWSMSSRVMADMWLKPMRNPDVKIPLNSRGSPPLVGLK